MRLRVSDRHSDSGTAMTYKRIYQGIAIALGVLLALTVWISVMISRADHLVLIAEVIIIVLFAAYWATQTFELLHVDWAVAVEARPTRAVAP